MNKTLFTKADEQTIDIVDRAPRPIWASSARRSWTRARKATCFTAASGSTCRRTTTSCSPAASRSCSRSTPAASRPRDHTAKLLDLKIDPSLLPENVTLRDFGGSDSDGQNKYMLNLYLRERGDANIRSNADLIANSNFHADPKYPDRKRARENVEKVAEYNMAERLLRRFSVQQMMLQCMAEQKLDALVYPTSNLPPRKLGAPGGPPVNGRAAGVWSFLGAQGFPVITVPAGFTTESYDLIRDPSAPATPEVGVGKRRRRRWRRGGSPGTIAPGSSGPSRRSCQSEWTSSGVPSTSRSSCRIAAAYKAATKHRRPPLGVRSAARRAVRSSIAN